MIDKRLVRMVPGSGKGMAKIVGLSWISLVANIAMMMSIAFFLNTVRGGFYSMADLGLPIVLSLVSVVLRHISAVRSSIVGHRMSTLLKLKLRQSLFEKLEKLGPSYSDRVPTAQVVQLVGEGVDQLEIYLSGYLPQLFYSMLAPITLFVVVSQISFKVAIILLLCVPLIPFSIVMVQKIAKALFFKYWGSYVKMGDSFLENLQGLTTLKIYQADARKHEQMNVQAEEFRKATMRVLTMQLNSISVMDIIAYGGAALGMILAVMEFQAGRISFTGCVIILLLSADFFLPLRALGSFFHIAMNGMSASKKIFQLLAMEDDHLEVVETTEDQNGTNARTKSGSEVATRSSSNAGTTHPMAYEAKALDFRYTEDVPVLKQIEFRIPRGEMYAFVGESGSGKSTIAALMRGHYRNYQGSLRLAGEEISGIVRPSLVGKVTYVDTRSFIFKGTIAENLKMANPEASDAELWAVLERVELAGFAKSVNGLDTKIDPEGANLSGGQRQRLAMARALLKDSDIYIFDEATSNIDVESEETIIREMKKLAETKTVIVIAHRLATVVESKCIFVLERGSLVEAATHDELLAKQGVYAAMWTKQAELEAFGREVWA